MHNKQLKPDFFKKQTGKTREHRSVKTVVSKLYRYFKII